MSESKKKRVIDLCWLWMCGICILLVLWISASTVEIWLHNTEPGYTYWILNFWEIITGR